MNLPFRPSRRRGPASRGVTLPEVLITGVIFALVSALLIRANALNLRREELNVIAIDLSGWLETIQREAMSRNNTAGQANPCTVTISVGELGPGAVLARTQADCAPGSATDGADAVFVLPNTNTSSPFRVESFLGTQSSASPRIVFSPRGTTTLTVPLTIEFAREGSPIARCLRVQALLGFLSIGAANNVTPTTGRQDCPESSFDGVL